MRSATFVVVALAPLWLFVVSFGVQGCASNSEPRNDDQCDQGCISECEGQCTTYGDPEHYDECIEGCSCGCG